MMSYNDFLSLIKQNTGNELHEYRQLCRFCLENQTADAGGIRMGDNNNYISSSEQQRCAILTNYNIITKQYLLISDEYPNFVCSACETQLSHYAHFTQQIEQNSKNWDNFLNSVNEPKDCRNNANEDYDHNACNPIKYQRIEGIEIEFCGRSDDDNNAMSPVFKVERSVNATATGAKRKRKTESSSFTNCSTEFERTCKHCDEPTFSSLARLYSHQRKMHPGIKISSCDICCVGFISKHAVLSHMNDRHAKCGRKHQCQFCAKLFYSDREVKGHEKMHLNAKSYICNLCGKRFNQKTTLNVHLKSKVHNANYKTVKPKKYPKRSQPNSTKKIYRCEQCIPSTVYASAEERTNHRNNVHRIYECEICKNGFLTPESLDSHRSLHASNKPRPFVCSVCEATFSQSSHLSSHFKRRHTNEKRYQCRLCSRKFYQNFELTSHVNLIHNNKRKRAKCGQCESDFATVKNLQKHILDKHSNEPSPYDCKICGKKNPSAAMMELHRRKKHKEYST